MHERSAYVHYIRFARPLTEWFVVQMRVLLFITHFNTHECGYACNTIHVVYMYMYMYMYLRHTGTTYEHYVEYQ